MGADLERLYARDEGRCEVNETQSQDPELKKILPDGPWQHEPDRVEFRHGGLPCLLKRAPYGQWCGYVGVPPGHPWHKKSFGSVPAQVHGDLTYGKSCDEELAVCHIPQPGESDDIWWLGFDCGHRDDCVPRGDEARMQVRMQNMFSIFGSSYEEPDLGTIDGEYRDVAFVRAETIKLAGQVYAAGGAK